MPKSLHDLSDKEAEIAFEAVSAYRERKEQEEAEQHRQDEIRAGARKIMDAIGQDGKDYITVFAAGYNSDTTEGRGPTRYTHRFFTREEAEACKKRLPGVFGTPNETKVIEERVYLTCSAAMDTTEADLL